MGALLVAIGAVLSAISGWWIPLALCVLILIIHVLGSIERGGR